MTTTSQTLATTDHDHSQERVHAAHARRQLARVGLNAASIERFLRAIVATDLHAKTILSLSLGTLGVLHAASLCIHVIGRAMAWARGTDPKHAIKQFDRLLSNANFSPSALARSWVSFVLGERKEAWIALDWTEFDADDQATLCAYLVTRHGRATPLLWKTVEKDTLKGRRNQYEDELLETLRDCVPETVNVTIAADRGFGDQKRYEQIRALGFHYVIRFRQDILLTDQFGEQKPAIEWLHPSGRARMLKKVAVTADCYIPPAIVLAHDKKMQESWCIATSRDDLSAAEVVRLYGRRFSIEETFRDTKDIHFGMGLSATHIGDPARRDRLLFIAAFAHVLLTLLGAAGERCHLDRTLKSNTSKTRTLSLYNQGCYWYMAIPNMREERLVQLMTAYGEVLHEHEFIRELLGVI
jgi:Transposase DDE domain